VDGGTMPSANVAFFKFCYVDFDDSTNATAVFNAYKTAMETLEAAHPGIKFVWWTAPIQTDYLASRHEFNELVRDYCEANNKILFDIASIESHKPDDSETNASQPTLYSGYTSDGGHLNDAGALRVARAWQWLMARIAGWDGQG
jgi:lysophospholipase L1-like esterase